MAIQPRALPLTLSFLSQDQCAQAAPVVGVGHVDERFEDDYALVEERGSGAG